MRWLEFLTVLLGVSLLAACSFSSDFIVVNDAQQPVEVTYRFKFAGLISRPATVPRSEVSTRRPEHWQELTTDRYEVNQVWRTVRLRLMPGEALRLASVHEYSSHESRSSLGELPIDEISIRGASGEMVFRGEQVRLNFVKQGTQVFTMTYK